MTDQELTRAAARRLAIIRHAQEVTGNVALTCRYFGISRTLLYVAAMPIVFGRAIVVFAEAYADRNDRDHRLLADAVRAGRIVAERGI